MSSFSRSRSQNQSEYKRSRNYVFCFACLFWFFQNHGCLRLLQRLDHLVLLLQNFQHLIQQLCGLFASSLPSFLGSKLWKLKSYVCRPLPISNMHRKSYIFQAMIFCPGPISKYKYLSPPPRTVRLNITSSIIFQKDSKDDCMSLPCHSRLNFSLIFETHHYEI